jgi:hypothetical protein
MPNAAPLSAADRQMLCVRNGTVIDHQTHLGFDSRRWLGQCRDAAGVAFVGPLGIYSTTSPRYGLGLFTLYHLSATASAGRGVARGGVVARPAK